MNLDENRTNCMRLRQQFDRRNQAFEHCFYSEQLQHIERNTYIRLSDRSNNSYTITATIPYIRGTSETIARILYCCIAFANHHYLQAELRRAQLNGIGRMRVKAPLAAAKRPLMIPEHSSQATCF